MKRIGVLTSGGDCSGMNACIRAIVRKAVYEGIEVVGIRRGFAGLMEGDSCPLNTHSVSGIICQGGTILGTARAEGFLVEEGQRRASDTVRKLGIEGLIVIGGDGSFRGAYNLNKKWQIPTTGIPATIDNDIAGSDLTIGFVTALNTALEAIDKLRDTATAHNRLFIVEVMGRTSGYIALWAGLAGGAEEILIPEMKTDLDEVCRKLEEGRIRGKTSSIIVVAEGDEAGGAFKIGKKIREKIGYEVRVAVLGHLQRGGSPTVLDRILATRLGADAVEVLKRGDGGKMVGLIANQVEIFPLEHAWREKKEIDLDLYQLSQIMAI